MTKRFKEKYVRTVYGILRGHWVMNGWTDEYIRSVALEVFERKLGECNFDPSQIEDATVAGEEELETWIDCA